MVREQELHAVQFAMLLKANMPLHQCRGASQASRFLPGRTLELHVRSGGVRAEQVVQTRVVSTARTRAVAAAAAAGASASDESSDKADESFHI